MYKTLRNLLFLLAPEPAHAVSMTTLKTLCSIPFACNSMARLFGAGDTQLSKQVLGLTFKNPVGLGAGFDKNAQYIRELEALGFGFIEIGTVTPRPQPGNPKPRVFRLPKDKALINRMGFNNDGVEVVAKRLKDWREGQRSTVDSRQSTAESQPQKPRMIIAGNIGKNKVTPNEEAWKDYEICFRALHPYVDFFVVNVSSPNTPGLRELQEKDSLRKILTHLQDLNQTFTVQRPILLKIAPDLTWTQVDDVISLAGEINLDGLVATNTTIAREPLSTDKAEVEKMGAGGLSGKPLETHSTEIVQYIHQKAPGLPIIGSGGIFTGQDAGQKMSSGATLVEVWTGFIYEGPFIVKRICEHLRNVRF